MATILISILSLFFQVGSVAHHWDDVDCRWVDLQESVVEVAKPDESHIVEVNKKAEE